MFLFTFNLVSYLVDIMKPFFKIIVPNYNNMPYIKKCLDSLLNQTFTDWFCVIVDDMSTDFSNSVCRQYEEQHPDHFKLIQLYQKKYAGGARNIGLEEGTESEYIVFLDSDDWFYTEKSLEHLHDAVKDSKPLMLSMPMYFYYGEKSTKNRVVQPRKTNISTVFRSGPGPGRLCISYKLKDVKFAENRTSHEDVLWFLRCIDLLPGNDIQICRHPILTYNLASVTSITHSSHNRDKDKVYDSTIGLKADLQNEVFKRPDMPQIVANYIKYIKTPKL